MVDGAYEENKTIKLSQAEVNALKKAILYLKFTCEETDSLLYASSPLINSVLGKLLEVDDLSQFSKGFYAKKNTTNQDFLLEKIKCYSKEIDRDLKDDEMQDIFKEGVYPFSLD